MRKCRNWQTSKTKDIVIIAIVWVQVPSSASKDLNLWLGSFFADGDTNPRFMSPLRSGRRKSEIHRISCAPPYHHLVLYTTEVMECLFCVQIWCRILHKFFLVHCSAQQFSGQITPVITIVLLQHGIPQRSVVNCLIQMLMKLPYSQCFL